MCAESRKSEPVSTSRVVLAIRERAEGGLAKDSEFSTMAWVRLRLADGVQASETGRRRWRVRQRAPGAATHAQVWAAIPLAAASLALDSSPSLPLTHSVARMCAAELQSCLPVSGSHCTGSKTTLDSGHVVPVGARCAACRVFLSLLSTTTLDAFLQLALALDKPTQTRPGTRILMFVSRSSRSASERNALSAPRTTASALYVARNSGAARHCNSFETVRTMEPTVRSAGAARVNTRSKARK